MNNKLRGLYGWVRSTPFGLRIENLEIKRSIHHQETRGGLSYRGLFLRKRWRK